ncbi:MAG: hypothetical protein E5V21_06290 [Mesorhizobium sp.]|nr:MAG: hypothetical protein E5V21_06290 [Mesorhizobium sp.]TIY10422.1 MAG: hypothetical protein E5V16_12020 [Mesorhizobium sp.]
MPANDALLAAVAKLDMIELCGRIISNPERNAPRATVAEVYALAKATEGLWAIALEADLLARAVWMFSDPTDARHHAVKAQAERVDRLMAAIRTPNHHQPGE